MAGKKVQNKPFTEQEQHDLKIMERYVQKYNAKYPPKEGEQALPTEKVVDVLKAILEVSAALLTGKWALMITTAGVLVDLAKKYGPVIWDMYKNYRRRQQRRAEQKKQNVVPTKSVVEDLAKLSKEKEKGQPSQKLQKFLQAHEMGSVQSKNEPTILRKGREIA